MFISLMLALTAAPCAASRRRAVGAQDRDGHSLRHARPAINSRALAGGDLPRRLRPDRPRRQRPPGPNRLHEATGSAVLAADGIAVLRIDKRGIAASRKALAREEDVRLETYANDLATWIVKLRQDSRFTKVGFMGHSEGALIGLIALAKPKFGRLRLALRPRPALTGHPARAVEEEPAREALSAKRRDHYRTQGRPKREGDSQGARSALPAERAAVHHFDVPIRPGSARSLPTRGRSWWCRARPTFRSRRSTPSGWAKPIRRRGSSRSRA